MEKLTVDTLRTLAKAQGLELTDAELAGLELGHELGVGVKLYRQYAATGAGLAVVERRQRPPHPVFHVEELAPLFAPSVHGHRPAS